MNEEKQLHLIQLPQNILSLGRSHDLNCLFNLSLK
jgi:hypothetical protein